MRFPRHISANRLCMGVCLAGALALSAGCDGGSAPEATPAETAKLQKNESEARQKAFGKSGVPNVSNAKAAKSLAGSPAPAPAKEEPAK